MLERVPCATKRFQDYRGVVSDALYEEIRGLADDLRGARVLHVNSTATGGGVAELLRSTVPLLSDLGVRAEWQVVRGSEEFFRVTKAIHNGLQGGPDALADDDWARYESTNEEIAAAIDPDAWDCVVVHDPQPAPARSLVPGGGRPAWVWRCHIDLSRPTESQRRRFEAYIAPYDATVFTLEQYVMDGFRRRHATIAPGIDPLAAKNERLDAAAARRAVERFGVDPDRPLVTQVSRFDRWKNPLGAIQAWEAARRSVPGLQLALVGEAAHDDPEGAEVLREVRAEAGRHRDVHVVADRADDLAVNAFQTASDVVLQLSTREGFGLTVSEALWSGTPVVGGDAGGIPLQIEHGRSGFLVRSPTEAAGRLVQLLRHPARARAMGAVGHDHVRNRFLLPRMVRDDLALWAGLVHGPKAAGRGRTPAPGGRATEPS